MFKNIQSKDDLRIGIISDTHGLLRPAAVDALQGSGLIIHAGDIGKEGIIDELSAIAPVIAVRGNMDSEIWAYKFQRTEVIELNNTLLYVIHNISALDLDPAASHIKAVISGHTHRPSISSRKGVLYINPGSAGPKRFTLPVSVALLSLKADALDARIVEII
ncbi:MAG: metallophosphoesterase family protein [Nitrospirae bacterium]|nr:metallophosphoesterase family protein [Nitrospirota bacterium]